jgi:hypothetical protein
MTRPMTFECDIHFQKRGQRRRIETGPEPAAPAREAGKVPRVSRLMALALHCEVLIAAGEVANYAAIAELGHVTRARVTQIMNLLNLAPDIQEALLFLPRTQSGRDPLHLRLLQPIAAVADWKKQRAAWRKLAREVV